METAIYLAIICALIIGAYFLSKGTKAENINKYWKMQKTLMNNSVVKFSIDGMLISIVSVGHGNIIAEIHYKFNDNSRLITFYLLSMRNEINECVENAKESEHFEKVVFHIQ